MEEKKYMLWLSLNLQMFAEEEQEDNNDNELDEDDFEDEDNTTETDSEPSGTQEQDTSTKQKQSRKENSRQAQLRREREEKEKKEREEKLRKDAYLKGQLDSTKFNTFTNKEIKDEHDLKIYQLQLKIKEQGGDPIEDLPEYLSKLEREEHQKKVQEEETRQKGKVKIENDLKEFKEKYPKVNLTEVLQDSTFKQFSEGRLENESLLEVYESFKKFKKEIIEKYKKEQEEKNKQETAKKESKTPGSSTVQTQSSSKTYLQMTEEERQAQLKKEGLIR